MVSPSKTTDGLLPPTPAPPLDGDEGAPSTAVQVEHTMSLDDSPHLPENGNITKDQVMGVNQEPGQKPDVSNKDQSASQDSEEADNETNEANKKPTASAHPLILEIRALQERLSQLEQQARHEPINDGQDFATHADGGLEDGRLEDEKQKRLRKHIRRARRAKKSVELAEKRAMETAEDREEYGVTGPYLIHYKTSYCVPRLDEGAVTDFATEREYDMWRSIDHSNPLNKPVRAIRPPTALRPIYSRKLGPPTEWDTSDSGEWSDNSTRSRDFDYFRSRLRGDFEWELDRLNAQRRRYLKHKEKKKTQQEQGKREQEDIFKREKLVGAGILSKDGLDMPDLPPETVENKALAKLHPVEWDIFRALRGVPESSCFAIDILVEEPKISVNTWKAHSKASVLSSEAQTISAKSLLGYLDGQGPLPERIRIHSRYLIMILARIHGSKLVSEEHDENTSLVLLRPFRLLSHYDKEIRDWHSKLVRDHGAIKPGTESSNADPDGKQSSAETPKSDKDAKDAKNESPDVQSKKEEKPSIDDPEGYSTSTTALEHLPCLMEFMDIYISRKRAYLNSPACDKVIFSDIWHLFKPGDFVISTDGKQAYRVINVTSPPHKGTDRWSYFYASEKENEKSRAQSDISVDCVYIHYDGKKLGPVLESFKIRRFDGERSVTTLEIYPLRFYASRGPQGPAVKSKPEGSEAEEVMETGVAQLRRDLIERGKMFVEVAGVKHMYYAGLTVDTRDEVESQVVIDFEEAFVSEKLREWRPIITPLMGFVNDLGERDEESGSCKADCCWQENVHNDSYVEIERSKKFTNDLMAEIEDSPQRLPSVTIYPRSLEDTKTKINALKDDELLIMSYRVFGFVLRDRTWTQLDLSYLEHIDKDDGRDDTGTEDDDSDEEAGDESAFGRLVLPKGHKRMVLSLIAQHFRSKGLQDEQADIVRGKGKGLIILLHGAPGVGKTTTAEGVAERFKKPLFQITCGDLGADAKQVETALQTNFALANRWGCILLLDEADVFLAERRREDFTRNGLVAVFLRVLEYYAGILFLTTNRIGDFDEAFASRIHMSLHYPPLDKISTTKVFKLNLGIIQNRYEAKSRKIKIEEDEILENIGEYFRKNEEARWNGRQIRNACQTALALAEFDAQPRGKKYDLKTKSTSRAYLKASHLQIVSNAYLEFIQYLKEVHGTNADTRAKESGIRALETVITAVKTGKGIAVGKDGEREEKPLSRFKLNPRPQSQTQTSSAALEEQDQ